jgi:hypothetical protein
MSSEDWAGVKEAFRGMKQERHAEWFKKNMEVLRASGLAFTEHTTSVVFREPGKPAVDFYPHTGRWRLVGRKNAGGKTMSGGAKGFLAWYAKQSVPVEPAAGFEPVAAEPARERTFTVIRKFKLRATDAREIDLEELFKFFDQSPGLREQLLERFGLEFTGPGGTIRVVADHLRVRPE